MLALPTKGFQRSVNVHNVDLGVCSDWLEASALFSDNEITGSDVVDVLRENEIYRDQDFAWELFTDALNGLNTRARIMGEGYPLDLTGRVRIKRKDEWSDFTAYSFCLLLSLADTHPTWARTFGSDFTEQGELFEDLTAESVAASMHGWTIHTTGWTRTRTNRLTTVVLQIADLLGEATGNIARWSKQTAKESGLDLLCFRSFPDGRVGIPVYLCQCASGSDWQSKLKTPDLKIWGKLIDFASTPKKAFSMPFALSDKDFIQHCNVVDGLLLDRYRLLAPGIEARDWISNDLRTRLIDWMTPRVATLPQLEN